MNNLTLTSTDGRRSNCKIKDNFKRVYVLRSSNGNVKIGVSVDVEKSKELFRKRFRI